MINVSLKRMILLQFLVHDALDLLLHVDARVLVLGQLLVFILEVHGRHNVVTQRCSSRRRPRRLPWLLKSIAWVREEIAGAEERRGLGLACLEELERP